MQASPIVNEAAGGSVLHELFEGVQLLWQEVGESGDPIGIGGYLHVASLALFEAQEKAQGFAAVREP